MKITQLETVRSPVQPNLLFVLLHTDEGLVGLGESFFGAEAVESYLHETVAPVLLGAADPAPEAVAQQLLPYLGYQGGGAETRGNAAIDVALWDLLGKRADLPLYVLLGGPVRDRIPVYNTCAGPGYVQRETRQVSSNWGLLGIEERGPYEDLDAFLHRPGELARELVAEGFTAMKVWPFDRAAERTHGTSISRQELRDGVGVIAAIRDAVGDDIDVMLEMHGLWTRPAATRIIQAVQPYQLYWVEDPVRPDAVSALLTLRQDVDCWIATGETVTGRRGFLQLMEGGAVDVATVDIQWSGGLTEARKIATLADAYAVPVAPHDCTGPVSLATSAHLTLSQPNGLVQETARSFLRTWYEHVAEGLPTITDGWLTPTSAPGHGMRVRESLLADERTLRRVAGEASA